MELEFASPKVCDNPHGACSQLFKDDPVGWLWRIDNARWFSTQPDQCNKTSTYVFAGKTLIHCAEVSVETSELEVDASQNCVQGAVRIKGIPFDGTLSKNCYSIDDEKGNKLLSCRVSKVSLVRNLRTEISYKPTLPTSQYYRMVVKEENHHSEKQIKNPEHWFYKNYFVVEEIIQSLKKHEPFVGKNDAEVNFAILVTLKSIVDLEMERLLRDFEIRLCDIEAETKEAIGATHLGKLECAYKDRCK